MSRKETSPPSLLQRRSVPKNYSQLRAMLAISKASLRSITRNPSSVIFSILFPLIFIVVFGFLGGGFTVDIGVMQGSDGDNIIFQGLSSTPHPRFITDEPDSVLYDRLSKGKIDCMLKITPVYSDTITRYAVELKTNKASPMKGRFIQVIVENLVSRANEQYTKTDNPYVELKEELVEGRIYKSIDFILPGQLGFSILGAGVFGTSFIFLVLRETLVIKRFFATPVKKKYIIIGEALSRLIFSMSGAVVIILVGYIFFGFTLVNGFITFVNLLVVSAIGLFVFLGFGLMVSGIANNINAVPPIANLITLPQFLLAGTFFSIDLFPSWLQPIARILPLTYLNQALREISFEGAGIFDVGSELLILFMWAVIAYALTIKFFKWE